MIWESIPGWFSSAALYDRMVAEAPQSALFVEVGCWMGRSTVYLAQKIQESGKNIQLFAVDTFQGSPEEPMLMAEVERHGGSIESLFFANLKACGVEDLVQMVTDYSIHAAQRFPDNSIDFVFIDAAHDEASVRQDIRAWRPKVKKGGTLAGDDIATYQSVRNAVEAEFGGNYKAEGNSWVTWL